MSQIDIYIKPNDKIKLVRKANKYGVSVSKLMVTAALKCDESILSEDVLDDR